MEHLELTGTLGCVPAKPFIHAGCRGVEHLEHFFSKFLDNDKRASGGEGRVAIDRLKKTSVPSVPLFHPARPAES
jgi:hypothetical protein